MRMKAFVSTVVGCLALLLAWTGQTQAETFSAAAGTQSNAGPVCFLWGDSAPGSIGAVKIGGSECDFMHYVIPLYWRNFYSAGTTRTVRVRGKRADASSWISCTLYVVTSNGSIASSGGGSLTTTGSYGSFTVSVNNVTSTSTSFLACGMNGAAWLLNVEYSP
jgi:hypothetical protein